MLKKGTLFFHQQPLQQPQHIVVLYRSLNSCTQNLLFTYLQVKMSQKDSQEDIEKAYKLFVD
jgi:hypothetical protein